MSEKDQVDVDRQNRSPSVPTQADLDAGVEWADGPLAAELRRNPGNESYVEAAYAHGRADERARITDVDPGLMTAKAWSSHADELRGERDALIVECKHLHEAVAHLERERMGVAEEFENVESRLRSALARVGDARSEIARLRERLADIDGFCVAIRTAQQRQHEDVLSLAAHVHGVASRALLTPATGDPTDAE